MSQCIRFLGTLFLISLPEVVVSDITALRDVKFTQDYNKNEMPPSHDGKPLMVSQMFLKFIYSEKATKFCEISTLLLSYVVPVKSKVEISQNFVAFSEYINFNNK